MVLGMKMGRTDPKDRETLTKLYAKAREMWDRFEKQFDSCICFDLTGCHFDNEEERQKWLASGGHERCARIVENTARALCEVMEGPG